MASDSDVSPAKVGPYRVEARLGVGGMGEVFRGFDERLERPVALKQIRAGGDDGTALERFRREAKAIARLNHPAIVQIHDWVETDDGCWYVMELVEGRTLRSLIAKGPLPPARVVTVGIAVAEGLAAAHAAGIVHRDLKPDNVMITDAGAVKILDFGLAKKFHADADEVTLTDDGKLLGTVTAMSPEQALGQPVDERSDIFALGILLYRAAVGRSPFGSKNPMQTLTAICSRRQTSAAERNPAVPAVLSELVDHLLEKDPEDRPQSAREVLDRLRRIGADLAGDAPDPLESTTTASVTLVDGRVPRSLHGATQTRTSMRRSSERRQITVLSAELVDARGTPLDPELLYELLPELESLARELAERWQGHLERILDHRLVLCFGYPTTHDDEARRAVLAALELVERAAALRPGVTARAGLDTGLTVVAAEGAGERLLLGRVLDLAGAVQGAAEPGGVALSDTTHALVERFFETRPGTPLPDPGGGEPRPVHRVVAARESATPEREVELVARREELELLLSRWRRARAGEGQAVLVTGIAGIGKSRLVRELARRLEEEGTEPWRVYGAPEARGSALRPVIDRLRLAVGLESSDPTAEDLARLERYLDERGVEPADAVPFLGPLLGLPESDRHPAPELGPRRLRAEIQEAILTVILATAQHRPLALLVEDLHWLDPSTLDLVTLLIGEVEAAPLLVVLTSRPEIDLAWEQRSHLTQIHLSRLGEAQAEELIDKVVATRSTAGHSLVPELRRRILEKTDGVPIFVEELTRAVLESGRLVERGGQLEPSGPLDRLSLPATLRDSLGARLDRLGEARHAAQVAAVLGRTFTAELLSAVAELEPGELRQQLERLVSSELVLARGFGARRRYRFKHALIRDAAYDSLLARERARLHGRIAETLAERSEYRDHQPELLAHHLTEAGRIEAAVDRWVAAGELAISRSAHREGVDHLRRGLDLLPRLPEGAERDRRELALLTRLGAAASVLRGYSAPEVKEQWGRARELARELDDSPQLFWVLWGLWSYHLVRSEVDEALDLGHRLLRIADAGDAPELRLVALSALGLGHYFQGELEPARRHLDRAAELDDPSRDRPVASATGQDVGVVVLATRALVLWHLGEDEAAVASSEAALALAARVGHAYSLAFARTYAARLHQSRRDLAATELHARGVVELSEEKGFFWLTQGRFFLGCVRCEEARRAAEREEGSVDELLAAAARAMDEGLEGYRAAGARLSLTYMLAQRAELHLAAGELEDARHRLDEATDLAETTAERYWQPELHRLRAELLWAEGKAEEAAEASRRALELARERGDRAFEARAGDP